MKAFGKVKVQAHESEELRPKPPCKSGVSITNDGLGNSPILHHMFKEQAGCLLRRAILRSWNEYPILGKLIYHHHDCAIPLRLGQASDEIHGNTFPRPFGNRQQLQ